MSANRKKSIPLSAYDCSRLVTKHATRSQDAEKVLDASNHIPTINPEPTNITDQHKLMTDDTRKVLAARAEGYNVVLQRHDPLPFDNSNEYTTKKKTINEQKIRQNYVAPNSFAHI